ncbi:replication initiation factor domain-containing protein [Secundilactobacillus yichangensis]|uniref:replication initiation factor domain-containing protein n=1 Tax=Secundilactobacillus yichangensis TaxID=2799580 RepID=UPI001943AF3F
MKIGHGMIRLTQRDSLFCHVDYLRVRFEFATAENLITELMYLNLKTFYRSERALYGYRESYQRDDIRIMTSDPGSKLGTLLEMHSSGCRQLELALARDHRDWVSFFYDCSELNAKFKRLDIAINDTLGIIDVPRWIEKAKRDEFGSTFKSFRDFGQMKKERRGATLQFGSPQSDIQFVIYQKDIEQYQKNGQKST